MEEVLRIVMLIAAFTLGGMTVEISDLKAEITALNKQMKENKDD